MKPWELRYFLSLDRELGAEAPINVIRFPIKKTNNGHELPAKETIGEWMAPVMVQNDGTVEEKFAYDVLLGACTVHS